MKFVAAAVAASAILLGAADAGAADTVIHAGRLIDGVSKTPQTQVSILVRDGRVVSVDKGFTTPLGPTGGHGDAANGLDPELEHPGWTANLVDSPEAARRAVRRLKREGADLIKIMPSGGVMSIGDDPKLQLMEDDEIKAVIETAHSLGMKVAAHAHGKQAIDHALTMGVDSIEHGTYADAESYKLFKEHGAY